MCHERNSSLIAWTAAAAQVTFVVSISGSERQLRGSRRWDQGLRWLILEVVGAGSGRRWSLFGISRCLTNHDTDAEAARIRVPDSGFNLLKMLGESRALYKFPQPSLPCFSSPSWHYRERGSRSQCRLSKARERLHDIPETKTRYFALQIQQKTNQWRLAHVGGNTYTAAKPWRESTESEGALMVIVLKKKTLQRTPPYDRLNRVVQGT